MYISHLLLLIYSHFPFNNKYKKAKTERRAGEFGSFFLLHTRTRLLVVLTNNLRFRQNTAHQDMYERIYSCKVKPLE